MIKVFWRARLQQMTFMTFSVAFFIGWLGSSADSEVYGRTLVQLAAGDHAAIRAAVEALLPYCCSNSGGQELINREGAWEDLGPGRGWVRYNVWRERQEPIDVSSG